MATVFEPTEDGFFDLKQDGRVREYDVDPEDLYGAVRRARLSPTEVLVEDEAGHRVPLTRLGR